jgi:predicted dienelactone hydrolase
MICQISVFLVFCTAAWALEPSYYDPLKIPDVKIRSLTFDAKDDKRGRTLPVRVYLPESTRPAPVVVFSHGLGGSRDNNPYLGEHWAKRGYLVVFVQHPGSDESVWQGVPPLRRMVEMRKAASVENYMARTKDIPVLLDALASWNREDGHALKSRLDLENIGMSGHSFGALTTQAVSGQSAMKGRVSTIEPRLDAALMMSPSPPAAGDPAEAFSTIRIPCLLMTGTQDDSLIGNSTAADRLKVFPHLANAPAWQVVFDGANHMAFGDRELSGRPHKDPRYHRAILALSTAFWDAELKHDPAARAWLRGKGAKSVLDAKDVLQMNPKARN